MGVFLVFASSCDKDDDNGEIGDNKFTDPRDGKVYQTVIIGNQEWIAENLAYAPSEGNYWAYDNDNSNVQTYGYLYDWETALNVCPTGWHLPRDDEWIELIDYLGDNAGGKLKATGTIEAGTGLCYHPNSGATNETGFKAFPGGERYRSGAFNGIGYYGYWWSATDSTDQIPPGSGRMNYSTSHVSKGRTTEESGFSVRCLKDVFI